MLRQQSHSSDSPAPLTGSQPGSLHWLSSPRGLSQDEGQSRSPAEEVFCRDGALLTEMLYAGNMTHGSNLQAVTQVQKNSKMASQHQLDGNKLHMMH